MAELAITKQALVGPLLILAKLFVPVFKLLLPIKESFWCLVILKCLTVVLKDLHRFGLNRLILLQSLHLKIDYNFKY
jgi:hypothetical protein